MTAGMQDALAAIWERHREPILAQIATVERAALAALRAELDEPLREDAQREAHKLAGSLGSFGFAAGSERARRIEQLLQDGDPAASAPELCNLAVALRAAVEAEHAPVVAAVADPGAAEPAASADDDAPLVLIVDDDEPLAGRLAAEATRRGLRAEVAATPAAARAAVARERPALVLLDLTFDGRTAEAYELLSSLTEQPRPVPVLVSTVRDVFTDRVEVARRGGRGFVSKALGPAQVVEQIEQLLERISAADITLLAVDDDPAMLELSRRVLEPEGMRVVGLPDPLRFWDELARVSPDMLLLDIDMPGVTGIELCRVVRNDPRWASIPVLFLTSRRDEQTVMQVFAAGGDDYMSKPVIAAELVGRVRNRIERLRLHRFIADRDALTGLRNRSSSAEAIQRLLALSERFRQPLALAALDLDHFKDVNDRHGHAAGDAVLRRLGELLLGSFRGEDVTGRWGGEELVVALYGMSGDDALRRIQALLAALREERFAGADGESFTVTFSAGVATFPGDGADLAALHRAADAALYAAKEAGRARVQLAGEATGAAGDQPDVVVVDDDPALREVLVHSLQTHGHRVHALADGPEAAGALAGADPRLRPRLVVLDHDLPGRNGVSVLRQLRADGVLARTSVIMLTGHSSEQAVLETLHLGAVDHLAKPFSVPVLMHKIAQALEARSSSRRAS